MIANTRFIHLDFLPIFLLFPYFFVSMRIQAFTQGLTIMKIPIEMLKEIRESGYDKQLVYHYIRELLDSEKKKFPKENNNLELLDNYLLTKDIQEPDAEIVMAAELLDNYGVDKRFMRELEDRDEYDAA